MALKQKMKNFFTLTRKGNGGFTLVELIVVIAILAILGGVAVPAYSGYVTKANKQADISLASEVEQALLLKYYAEPTNATRGYVVLTTDGAITDGDFAAAAMTAVFGEGWPDSETVSLKYDGWDNAGLSANVTAIDGSSFAKENLSSMLDSVSGLTNVLSGFLDSGVISIDDLNAFAKANGIDPATASGQELANMMPMVVAQNLTNKLGGTITIDGTEYNAQSMFEEEYSNPQYLFFGGLADKLQADSGLDMDMYTAYAVEYAQVEGMLNYLSNNGSDADKEKGQTLLAQWKQDTANLQGNYNGSGQVMVRTLLTNTKQAVFNSGISESVLEGYTTQLAQDAKAFSGYMEGLNETSSALLSDSEGLQSSTYYKDSAISDLVLNYLDASENMVAMGVNGSAVVVAIDRHGNTKIIMEDGK